MKEFHDEGIQEYEVTKEMIATFKREGVVVLPGVFTSEEIEEAKEGFAKTLQRYGVVSFTDETDF